jgi:hypothetical protein
MGAHYKIDIIPTINNTTNTTITTMEQLKQQAQLCTQQEEQASQFAESILMKLTAQLDHWQTYITQLKDRAILKSQQEAIQIDALLESEMITETGIRVQTNNELELLSLIDSSEYKIANTDFKNINLRLENAIVSGNIELVELIISTFAEATHTWEILKKICESEEIAMAAILIKHKRWVCTSNVSDHYLNFIFNHACAYGHIVLVNVLLDDERYLKFLSYHEVTCVKEAIQNDQLAVVDRLLQVPFINERFKAARIEFVKIAIHHNCVGVIYTLIRTIPVMNDGFNPIRFASMYGSSALMMDRILQDYRWDPAQGNNEAIYNAVEVKKDIQMVDRLMKDERVNPADMSNRAYKSAQKNGLQDIQALLLKDSRVRALVEQELLTTKSIVCC